jgi:hypothetical protein
MRTFFLLSWVLCANRCRRSVQTKIEIAVFVLEKFPIEREILGEPVFVRFRIEEFYRGLL